MKTLQAHDLRITALVPRIRAVILAGLTAGVYVASRASWIVASIVLASGLMAGTPAQANGILTIDVISFTWTDNIVKPECCIVDGEANTGDPMFFVENTLTVFASSTSEASSLIFEIGFEFEDDAGPLPNLSNIIFLEALNTGPDLTFGYSFFEGSFGPFNVAYAPALSTLIGLYTANIISAEVCTNNPGCVGPVFPTGVLSSSFRVVPEPTTLAIFGLGLAGLGFFMTRRRRVV